VDERPVEACALARLNALIVKLLTGNLELLGHEVLEAIKGLLALRTLRFQEQFAPTFSPEAEQLPNVLHIGSPALTRDAKNAREKSRMLAQKDRGTHVDPVDIVHWNTAWCIFHR
jgi:hypothetical protein